MRMPCERLAGRGGLNRPLPPDRHARRARRPCDRCPQTPLPTFARPTPQRRPRKWRRAGRFTAIGHTPLNHQPKGRRRMRKSAVLLVLVAMAMLGASRATAESVLYATWGTFTNPNAGYTITNSAAP